MMLTDRLPTIESAETRINPGIFRSEIESVSSEIRRICEDLSPSVLENVGLAAALEWALTNAVAHLPEEKKFTYEFNCQEGLEERLHLAPDMQIHLYRIAQEVINNISRHAGASQVRLDARIEDSGDFVLEIEDNGLGFDLAKAEKTGRGIANIRSRASLIEAEVAWKRGANGTLFTLHKAASLSNES
jgi:signal transduction histidine kinase